MECLLRVRLCSAPNNFPPEERPFLGYPYLSDASICFNSVAPPVRDFVGDGCVHRSHFGSRYPFGLMRANASLFSAGLGNTCLLRLRVRFFDQVVLPRIVVASGHTAANTPDLFRTPKLSAAGPG